MRPERPERRVASSFANTAGALPATPRVRIRLPQRSTTLTRASTAASSGPGLFATTQRSAGAPGTSSSVAVGSRKRNAPSPSASVATAKPWAAPAKRPTVAFRYSTITRAPGSSGVPATRSQIASCRVPSGETRRASSVAAEPSTRATR